MALGPMRIALDLERNFLVQISGSSDQAASGAVGLLGGRCRGRCDHTVHTVNSGRWRFKSESACPRAGHGSSRKSTRTCNRDIFLSHPVRHGPSALSVGYESELRRARSVEVEHTWGRGTAGLSRGYLEGSGTGGHAFTGRVHRGNPFRKAAELSGQPPTLHPTFGPPPPARCAHPCDPGRCPHGALQIEGRSWEIVGDRGSSPDCGRRGRGALCLAHWPTVLSAQGLNLMQL